MRHVAVRERRGRAQYIGMDRLTLIEIRRESADGDRSAELRGEIDKALALGPPSRRFEIGVTAIQNVTVDGDLTDHGMLDRFTILGVLADGAVTPESRETWSCRRSCGARDRMGRDDSRAFVTGTTVRDAGDLGLVTPAKLPRELLLRHPD